MTSHLAILNVGVEVLNELWVILILGFFVVIITYIVDVARSSHVRWVWPPHYPLSLKVAVSIVAADLGNLVVAGSVWYWQAASHGFAPFNSAMLSFIILGSVIRAIGMLCKIRVFSREMFGHIPWIVTGLTVIIYVAVRFAIALS